MLKTKTKDIEVNGNYYRLNKMDARTGSYVAMRIATLTNGTGDANGISNVLNNLSRRDFDELQTIVLQCVNKLTDGIPEPILKSNGDFVDEELKYDAPTVINLTMQCLMFNIGGFFTEAGLV